MNPNPSTYNVIRPLTLLDPLCPLMDSRTSFLNPLYPGLGTLQGLKDEQCTHSPGLTMSLDPY